MESRNSATTIGMSLVTKWQAERERGTKIADFGWHNIMFDIKNRVNLMTIKRPLIGSKIFSANR